VLRARLPLCCGLGQALAGSRQACHKRRFGPGEISMRHLLWIWASLVGGVFGAVAPLAMAEEARNLLDPALIATLPRQATQIDVHGHSLHCDGVSLIALLRASGTVPATPLRGADLAKVVRIRASDGYRVTFSLGELDESLGAHQVLLADRCEGAALSAEDGPWRLLVPADGRPARSARQVEWIGVGE